MKEFTDKFIQTLLFNLATIAAIVVAIVQFSIRAWKENNGNEKVRVVINNILRVLDDIIDRAQNATAVPVVKVSTKSPKRTRKVQ